MPFDGARYVAGNIAAAPPDPFGVPSRHVLPGAPALAPDRARRDAWDVGRRRELRRNELLTGSRRMIGIATAPLTIEKDPFFSCARFSFHFRIFMKNHECAV